MGAKARPRRAQPARQSIRTVYRPSAALRGVALGLMLLLGVAALGFAYVSTLAGFHRILRAADRAVLSGGAVL
ncbi:hypothetical protein SE17_43855, partial [Kouleothrix aurantiaca]